MLLILGMTTTVGLLRTADHKSEVELLQSASTAPAALEHARGEFLNATNSLAGLAITKDPIYFFKYQQSRNVTLDDLTMARTLAT